MHVKCLAACCAAVVAVASFAEDGQRKFENATAPEYHKATDFKLTIRKGNGAYGTAAYSFRFATQDANKHRNLVDLVYNRCRQLHVNAHGGMRSRIVDLGQVDFGTPDEPPARGWHQHCIRPRKNHVYIQEINDGRHKAYVKFLIADVQQDGTLKVKWVRLGGDREIPQFSSRGRAGTMGQCGGFHQER